MDMNPLLGIVIEFVAYSTDDKRTILFSGEHGEKGHGAKGNKKKRKIRLRTIFG